MSENWEPSAEEGASTPAANRIRRERGEGPGLLSRLPGMAYQCRNDSDWTMEFVTAGCRDLTGCEPAELLGEGGLAYADLIHPEDQDRVWKGVQRAVEKDRPFELEYRIATADGEEKWVWEQGHPVRSADGELLGLEGFITDVTQLRRKSEELDASRRMLGALAEQSLFGVYVIQDDVFRYVNEAFADTFGYERREIVNRLGPAELVVPEDRETVEENIRRRVEGEVPALGYSFRGLRKDGSRIDVEVYGARSKVGGEAAVSGVLLDITEQKKLEEQVVRAQKMEAVGLLASGIAHDFNNILTAVGGHAQLLLDEVSVTDEAEEIVEGLTEIRRAANRATSLTRQMLVFARDSRSAEAEASDLNGALAEVREMVETMTGDAVEVEWSLDAEESWVRLDAGRLGQIVMNLVANARDAMPEGGRLTIRTTAVELHEDYANTHFEVEPGRYGQLSVRDTGGGMPPEVRERIFEPFYSTKERGKGTGLGLSTVYGIVKRAGGHVWVYSEPGQGSHFKIHLPLAERTPAEEPRVEEPVRSLSLEGSETILLVDDDPAVLSVSQKILERYGYAVVAAGDAEEAVRRYEERGSELDLLITDVVLPTRSGPRLVEGLRESGANLPVIFISGYTEESVNRTARLDPHAVFLEKPFDPKTLASTVRTLLDEEDGRRSRSG